MARTFSIMAMALFIAGCGSSAGQKMDQSRINEIQKGVTTRAEVEAKLGPPNYVGMLPDGRRQMIYSHYETQIKGTSFIPFANTFAGGTNTRRQELQVLLDKNNVVQDYEFTDRTGESTGMSGLGTRTETATPPGTK